MWRTSFHIVNASNGWHGKSTKGIAETDSFDFDMKAHGKFRHNLFHCECNRQIDGFIGIQIIVEALTTPVGTFVGRGVGASVGGHKLGSHSEFTSPLELHVPRR